MAGGQVTAIAEKSGVIAAPEVGSLRASLFQAGGASAHQSVLANVLTRDAERALIDANADERVGRVRQVSLAHALARERLARLERMGDGSLLRAHGRSVSALDYRRAGSFGDVASLGVTTMQ